MGTGGAEEQEGLAEEIAGSNRVAPARIDPRFLCATRGLVLCRPQHGPIAAIARVLFYQLA